MALKILAIIISLMMSFFGYMYTEEAKENIKANNHPILFLFVGYFSFFLSVVWIIIFCYFLGLY